MNNTARMFLITTVIFVAIHFAIILSPRGVVPRNSLGEYFLLPAATAGRTIYDIAFNTIHFSEKNKIIMGTIIGIGFLLASMLYSAVIVFSIQWFRNRQERST